MNVNLYLPDDLGRRAKEAELPLSQLLREVVTDELERRKAMAEALTGPKEFMLTIEDHEGNLYDGRLVGTEIASDDRDEVTVYIRERDEMVVVHDGKHSKFWELDDPEEQLRGWLEPSEYAGAMHALGIKPVIDL